MVFVVGGHGGPLPVLGGVACDEEFEGGGLQPGQDVPPSPRSTTTRAMMRPPVTQAIRTSWAIADLDA